jgi:hypothetical protein
MILDVKRLFNFKITLGVLMFGQWHYYHFFFFDSLSKLNVLERLNPQ